MISYTQIISENVVDGVKETSSKFKRFTGAVSAAAPALLMLGGMATMGASPFLSAGTDGTSALGSGLNSLRVGLGGSAAPGLATLSRDGSMALGSVGGMLMAGSHIARTPQMIKGATQQVKQNYQASDPRLQQMQQPVQQQQHVPQQPSQIQQQQYIPQNQQMTQRH